MTFTAHGPFRPFVACHCESCRRQSGHFVVATQCDAAALRIEGAHHLRDWRASEAATRRFCGTCGSQMFWVPDTSARVSIFAGCIDSPSKLPMGWHIHTGEKGDYYEIADGLPAFTLREGE